MNLGIKFVIYMILVSNCEQNVVSFNKVYKSLRTLRIRREEPVVQPEWTANDGLNLFVDYDVHVTDKKLQEAEALREMIQKTVDKNSYVVELAESDFENPEPATQSKSESDISEAEHGGVSVSELQSEPESVSILEPVPASESAPVAKPISEPETKSQPESPSELESVLVAPELEPQPEPEQKPKEISKPEVTSNQKRKMEKISKVSPLSLCVFLKKCGGFDLLSSTFAEWLKNICLPPWCKGRSRMWSFLYN